MVKSGMFFTTGKDICSYGSEVHICTVTLILVFDRSNHIIVVIDVRTSCHSKWFKTFLSSVMSRNQFH